MAGGSSWLQDRKGTLAALNLTLIDMVMERASALGEVGSIGGLLGDNDVRGELMMGLRTSSGSMVEVTLAFLFILSKGGWIRGARALLYLSIWYVTRG